MATTLKLKTDIKKLKGALSSKGLPASVKTKLKAQLDKAQNELKAMQSGAKPRKVSTTKGTKTALTSLQKLIQKKKFGVYQGKGIDLKKDADEGALPIGRRISKGLKGNQFGDKKSSKGHVYYEYRANRLDVKQPKKAQRYPKLEGGGELQSIRDKYLENEDNNAHSENVVLLAKHFGTKEELKEAKKIMELHEKEGHLSSENGEKRRKLHIKLIEKAREKMGKEGIEFKKGGKMPVIRTQFEEEEFEYAKGGGVLSTYGITFEKGNEKEYFQTEAYNKAEAMRVAKFMTTLDSQFKGYKPTKIEEVDDEAYEYAKGGKVWTIGEYQTIEDWNSTTKKDGSKTTTSAEGYPIRKNGVNVYVVKSKKEAIEKVKRLNSKMAKGGQTKSPKDYWNGMSVNERMDFLKDEYKEKLKKDNLLAKILENESKKDWDDLAVKIQMEFEKKGGYMANGGVTEKEVVESNNEMVLSQIKAVKHHADELSNIVSTKSDIEAWVVAKIERASTDLSDITHYLDGKHEKMSLGGTIHNYVHKMDKK